MTYAHNTMIRSLNAIYFQAPYVKLEEQRPFLQFIEIMYQGVEHHHRTENDIFFPILEEMTGDKGIMHVNIEHHGAFQPDLQAFTAYVRRCLAGAAQYDGKEIVRLIDTCFGPALWQHLADEILTFVALKEYGETLKGFHARLTAEAGKTQQKLGILAGVVFVMVNHKDFPPTPAPIS
ncbi:hypothetical protein F4677DRAFT_406866 [Hypoxylon crocopeplum]|nr:hypothetical protein F4677DRAFT_406866 [Hypoxylon crocopeplum]